LALFSNEELAFLYITGAQELLAYMKKEYCHENLRFWLAVQDLRYGPGTEAKIRKKVKEIWE
jgi:regulator of G-protein signaling